MEERPERDLIADGWPWSGLISRIVIALEEPERRADLIARRRLPADRALVSDWESKVREAEACGLVNATTNESDVWLRRTAFGEVWISQLDSSEWPLPGPGAFELWFYPLTQRPTFPVFAFIGAAVAITRQGGWNMKYGFGRAQPNPVTSVDMLSTLTDGTEVHVETLKDDWYALSVLRPTDLDRKDFWSINDQLMAALAAAASPWLERSIDVDGSTHQMLMLDIDSSELPTGVIGPPLLAIGTIDQVQITSSATTRTSTSRSPECRSMTSFHQATPHWPHLRVIGTDHGLRIGPAHAENGL